MLQTARGDITKCASSVPFGTNKLMRLWGQRSNVK